MDQIKINTAQHMAQYASSLIEACMNPVIVVTPEWKVMELNEAALDITGLTRAQLTHADFFSCFTDAEASRNVFQQVLFKEDVSDLPLTVQHKSGNTFEVLINGNMCRDKRGNALWAVMVIRKIPVQKLLSKYSLSLIEASRDPLFTVSLEGKITDVNNASVLVTGVSREQLLNTNFFDYFTDPEKAKASYQQVFKQGFVADYPLTIIDGELTDVLFNGAVYKDDQGNVIGAVMVSRDITAQKRVEKELIEAKRVSESARFEAEAATKRAENAANSKQQFLSNMSHEIRTPMNAIIGFTKVVLKTDLSAKQREYLTAIKMSGDALIVLINDILDLAKVDSGKMTFEQTPFKLSLSIAAMLHLFETKIQEKNLELVRIYDETIPEVLLGDPVRLHQIIMNLVSNAVKFTNKGTITVRANLLHSDASTATIEFSVSDTGIGIQADRLEYIFENFQQASSNTSRLYGGTGLGLAIVKQLVEQQQGIVRVISKVDEGSSFYFTLKFQKTTAPAVALIESFEFDLKVKNIRVLVVEDMALNQLLMKTLLDDFGFERDIANNGRIAIEKLESRSYDIVLMDLQMPEMNGFEATDHIRNVMKSNIPIIALTADVTTVDLARCKAVGMNDYIAKPVDERVLYSKIMGLIKLSQTKNVEQTSEPLALEAPIKYTDMNYLIQRTKNNTALIMAMISAYLEQTPPLIQAMRQNWLNKDWDGLHAVLHKMIPSFSIVGISTDFEAMAKKIMEFAKTQQELHDINDLVLALETVCSEACKELEAEFNRIKNIRTDD
jgi:PAS domain S-box-containing protein